MSRESRARARAGTDAMTALRAVCVRPRTLNDLLIPLAREMNAACWAFTRVSCAFCFAEPLTRAVGLPLRRITTCCLPVALRSEAARTVGRTPSVAVTGVASLRSLMRCGTGAVGRSFGPAAMSGAGTTAPRSSAEPTTAAAILRRSMTSPSGSGTHAGDTQRPGPAPPVSPGVAWTHDRPVLPRPAIDGRQRTVERVRGSTPFPHCGRVTAALTVRDRTVGGARTRQAWIRRAHPRREVRRGGRRPAPGPRPPTCRTRRAPRP